MFGEYGKNYARRRPEEKFNPKCVTRTMKHGGGKIQIWGCFTARDVGNIHHVKGIMDQKVYKQILIHHMRPSVLQYGCKDHIIFQLGNDPKHTVKSVKNYISELNTKSFESGMHSHLISIPSKIYGKS